MAQRGGCLCRSRCNVFVTGPCGLDHRHVTRDSDEDAGLSQGFCSPSPGPAECRAHGCAFPAPHCLPCPCPCLRPGLRSCQGCSTPGPDCRESAFCCGEDCAEREEEGQGLKCGLSAEPSRSMQSLACFCRDCQMLHRCEAGTPAGWVFSSPPNPTCGPDPGLHLALWGG